MGDGGRTQALVVTDFVNHCVSSHHIVERNIRNGAVGRSHFVGCEATPHHAQRGLVKVTVSVRSWSKFVASKVSDVISVSVSSNTWIWPS